MKALVAGATGTIGAELLDCLAEAGHWTRALTRGRRAHDWLRHEADEVAVADATDPCADLKSLCVGVDVVFSVIGQSTALRRQPCRRPFADIDTRANFALLAAARAAGVAKYVYVSVFGGDRARDLEYPAAYEEVVGAIAASGLDYCIVRPTRLYASYLESLPGSRAAARVPVIGNGAVRSNPVHEADVARACMDGAQADVREMPIGGPGALKRSDEAELLDAALSCAHPVRRTSAALAGVAGRLLRPFDARRAAMLRYRAATSQIDLLAPVGGQRSLEDYLIENAPR
jgi:uncharacterized protein YbjT (DUF2867 family)